MRKIFTLFILLLLLPVTALAADAPATLYVGNKQVISGNETTYWTTDKSTGGLTKYEGNDDSWNVKYDPSTATLTLNEAKISGSYDQYNNPFTAGIYAKGSSDQPVALTIELIGTNTITGAYGIFLDAETNTSSYGTNATLTITDESNGSLKVSGSSSYGIYVKSGTGNASLTIENASVDATSSVSYSSYAGVCVGSSDSATTPALSLAVNGGSLTTSASEGNDGIQFYVGSSEATGATTNLTVSDNAIVDARNGGISTNSSTATEIKSDSEATSGGIVFDGTEGTVYGNVELQKDLTINEGETLTIGKDASLTVPNGKTLTNNGTVTTEEGGTLTNNGKINNSGTLPDSIEGSQPPKITTTSLLPGGTVGTAYSQSLAADNNPTSWSVTEGDLPDDLSLNSDGTITGTPTTAGQFTFTATATNSAGSDSKELTLTINPAPVLVTSVALNKSELSLYTGQSEILTATVQPEDATNKNVTWSSDNADVATVDNGTVTAVSAGTATITVTTADGSKTATCIVTVTVPVTGVTLEPTSLSLFTGDTAPLTATVQPSDATNQNVTWSSDKPEVATVDNGKVTAVGAGEATITATAGGITATCVVHVRKPATVEPSGSTNLSFTTDRDEFSLTATVHAQGNDLNPKDGSWTWTVADADVVALSGSPTWRSQSYSISRQAFTIEGTGTTTITAIYDDGTYRGSVDFTVQISKPSPPDPISYYNIYVEDVCDGVEVSTSKQVVREGGSITVYVEKDTANYTFDNFKVYYKRIYYGGWEELKEGTQPGEYPIKNIWTHIYIKAEGAEEKEDPTGIESIEGVKVYTKDGSLYVQTPQREQVIIVSMSGAVVKNEEQIGLKQYHGLQPGIYIVRVGDRAYKVRLN